MHALDVSSKTYIIFSFIVFLCFAPALFAQKLTNSDNLSHANDHYVIALLVSSPKGQTSPKVEAIKSGARLRLAVINKSGGIFGKPVRLLILDDHKEVEKTIRNVKQALGEPQLIAILGLDSSSRGAKVIEAIGQSGVPFISDISLDSLFSAHQNIFSMTSSISGDAQVMTRFLGKNYPRPFFIGRQDELFAKQFHAALAQDEKISLKGVYWLPRNAEHFALAADLAIAEIKAKQPDILCVSVFSHQGAQFVKLLKAANIDIPIYFGTGSVFSVVQKTASTPYKGALFGIGRGIPNVQVGHAAQQGKWDEFKQIQRQFPDYLGNGIIYSDLMRLIATATHQKTGAKGFLEKSVAELRRQIVEALLKYRQGRKSFNGDWRNWSFTPARSSALSSFVLWAPDGGPKLQLWPVQQIATLAGLQTAPVAFVNVDLVRIDHIDSNKHNFDAEFYLSLSSSSEVYIDNMEFSNVVQGENGQHFLNIRQIYKNHSLPITAGKQDTGSGLLQQGWINKLYQIKGKFRFNPKLSQYPFDSQLFHISIQPKNTASPFLIQPNNSIALNNGAHIDGWRLHKGRLGEFVGYEEDEVIIARNYGGDQQTVSYYRFNFSWVAKRQTKDYFIRVVIPLVLILMVAYISVFLPTEKIDSMVAMKVTALLSTVALYFSIPKLDTETATLSDQIFVFSELIIVTMIFISIIRVHAETRLATKTGDLLFAIEALVFPVSAVLMYRYVIAVSEGKLKSIADETVAGLISKLMPQLF